MPILETKRLEKILSITAKNTSLSRKVKDATEDKTTSEENNNMEIDLDEIQHGDMKMRVKSPEKDE